MPNTTQSATKTCNACPYAGKCPPECRLSLSCPKEDAKPLLERIKAYKPHIYWQLMTCFDN